MRTPAFYLCLALATLCAAGFAIAEFNEAYDLGLWLWLGFVLLISVSAFVESDPAQEPN